MDMASNNVRFFCINSVAVSYVYFIIDPPDEVLGPALHQYAKECLTVEEKLARLNAEHRLCIKCVLKARISLSLADTCPENRS